MIISSMCRQLEEYPSRIQIPQKTKVLNCNMRGYAVMFLHFSHLVDHASAKCADECHKLTWQSYWFWAALFQICYFAINSIRNWVGLCFHPQLHARTKIRWILMCLQIPLNIWLFFDAWSGAGYCAVTPWTAGFSTSRNSRVWHHKAHHLQL